MQQSILRVVAAMAVTHGWHQQLGQKYHNNEVLTLHIPNGGWGESYDVLLWWDESTGTLCIQIMFDMVLRHVSQSAIEAFLETVNGFYEYDDQPCFDGQFGFSRAKQKLIYTYIVDEYEDEEEDEREDITMGALEWVLFDCALMYPIFHLFAQGVAVTEDDVALALCHDGEA